MFLLYLIVSGSSLSLLFRSFVCIEKGGKVFFEGCLWVVKGKQMAYRGQQFIKLAENISLQLKLAKLDQKWVEVVCHCQSLPENVNPTRCSLFAAKNNYQSDCKIKHVQTIHIGRIKYGQGTQIDSKYAKTKKSNCFICVESKIHRELRQCQRTVDVCCWIWMWFENLL